MRENRNAILKCFDDQIDAIQLCLENDEIGLFKTFLNLTLDYHRSPKIGEALVAMKSPMSFFFPLSNGLKCNATESFPKLREYLVNDLEVCEIETFSDALEFLISFALFKEYCSFKYHVDENTIEECEPYTKFFNEVINVIEPYCPTERAYPPQKVYFKN